MELWNVYDIHRIKTDRTALRGDKLEPGDFHLVVHVCLFNSMGEMLIQHRQPFKEAWPNMWDVTVGGSAIAGETSQEAVQRELSEELGIDLDFHNFRPHLTMNFGRGFDDIYLVERDIELTALTLQDEEVRDAKWASREVIIEMIDSGLFIPYYPSFIDLLFDIRKQQGAIQQTRRSIE